MAQTAGRVAKWVADQVFKAVLNWNETDAEASDDDVYLQCGKVVYDNVPANFRTELWLSQLHRRSSSGAAAAAQYWAILQKGTLNEEVVSEIDKDTHRTFPGHPRLSKGEGQQAMLNVLTAYAVLDPEIGYCQGMNFLVGLLLTYLQHEEQAFGVLVLLMEERQLRELYKPDMSLLQVRLWQLGKLLPSALGSHLDSLGVLPVLYASAWFLTCFGSDFPISFASRVLDVVITDCYAAPMMKVAVGILERCQELLLEMQDMEMILEHLKQDVPKWPKPVLQELLTSALAKPWTCKQMSMLDEMNGAETVDEAVARVNRLSQSEGETTGARGGGPRAAAEEAAAAAGRDDGGTVDMLGLGASEGRSGEPSAHDMCSLSSYSRTLSQLSGGAHAGGTAVPPAQLVGPTQQWVGAAAPPKAQPLFPGVAAADGMEAGCPSTQEGGGREGQAGATSCPPCPHPRAARGSWLDGSSGLQPQQRGWMQSPPTSSILSPRSGGCQT